MRTAPFIILFSCLIIFFQGEKSFAKISEEDLKELKLYEDSLKVIADSIVNGSEQGVRQYACYEFIPMLVRALKIENSYEYPFDSLTRINIMYADDGNFRIFNWDLQKTTGVYRYFGAIQRKSSDLKLFPLYDYSDYFTDAADTVTSNERWYGALYYQIIHTGKKYLLFGWDGNTLLSNKKIVDVLSFDKHGAPVFGEKIFNVTGDSAPRFQCRFMIEYKEDAQVSMKYIPDQKMIIYDHLVPIDPKLEGIYSEYVPDGSYEAFELRKKKYWVHISSVMNTTQDAPPFPNPVDFDKKKQNNNRQ